MFKRAVGQNAQYNSIHMSLIPVGPDQGSVLVWSAESYTRDPAEDERAFYWSIFDPETVFDANGTFNPEAFRNYKWILPPQKGDTFCAGHTWTSDGKLLMVGGTGWHGRYVSPSKNAWTGSRMAYLYDPTMIFDPTWQPGTGQTWRDNPSRPWIELPDTEKPRWYPSVITTEDPVRNRSLFLVAGGTANEYNWSATPPTLLLRHYNNYELWDYDPKPLVPSWGIWLQNPATQGFTYPGSTRAELTDYPRIHLLSDGRLTIAGFSSDSDRLKDAHLLNNAVWDATGHTHWKMAKMRSYGTSVLFPISISSGVADRIVAIAGNPSGAVGSAASATVEVSHATQTGAAKHWSPLGSNLAHPRMHPNSVLLPDSTIAVFGGQRIAPNRWGCSEDPVMEPEVYLNGQWGEQNPSEFIRDYHSVVLLLPNGKVLVGGGESRGHGAGSWVNNQCSRQRHTDPCDYQIFIPHYRRQTLTVPRVTSPIVAHGDAFTVTRGSTVTIWFEDLPLGVTIEKAVLMWPGSVTHHADTNQRCVEIMMEPYVPVTFPPSPATAVLVDIPSNRYTVPRGYYMLFLVTNQGIPSDKALWVKVE